MALDSDQLKQLFFSEAEDIIQRLNENMLKLEKEPNNKDVLENLMRASHTMKSSAATMGYKDMAYVTHVMEDIFDYARHNELEITKHDIDLLFHTLDSLESSFESVKKNDKELELTALAKKLKDATGVMTEGVGPSKRTADGKPVIEKKGSKRTAALGIEDSVDTPALKDIEKIEKISHIKVPVERLDALFDLVEELIIDKMRLSAFVSPSAKHFEGLSEAEALAKYPLIIQLRPTIHHLDRLVSSLQTYVMQARLVPLGQVLARFPRMVRDLARSKKKEITFSIEGSDLELDRTVVDTLGEPLLHLLRNAVDHGIDHKGKIKVVASRKRNLTALSVEDDGVGIDWEKVVIAAEKRGIYDEEKKNNLLKDLNIWKSGEHTADTVPLEIQQLIFHPELSTKEKVTETSGRGVGLSVVKNFTKEVGGAVIVESPLNNGGTRFTLELPSTLAITNALLVQVGEKVFAIPFGSVERSVFVPAKHIKSMADQDVAVVDGIDVPLVHLGTIFGYDNTEQNKTDDIAEKSKKASDTHTKYTVVLIQHGRDTAGFVVDRLLDEQEIIVKGLPPALKDMKGFSGSSILGDGSTILILDIPSILEDHTKLLRIH